MVCIERIEDRIYYDMYIYIMYCTCVDIVCGVHINDLRVHNTYRAFNDQVNAYDLMQITDH